MLKKTRQLKSEMLRNIRSGRKSPSCGIISMTKQNFIVSKMSPLQWKYCFRALQRYLREVKEQVEGLGMNNEVILSPSPAVLSPSLSYPHHSSSSTSPLSPTDYSLPLPQSSFELFLSQKKKNNCSCCLPAHLPLRYNIGGVQEPISVAPVIKKQE